LIAVPSEFGLHVGTQVGIKAELEVASLCVLLWRCRKVEYCAGAVDFEGDLLSVTSLESILELIPGAYRFV
jgi:hypothetical protein